MWNILKYPYEAVVALFGRINEVGNASGMFGKSGDDLEVLSVKRKGRHIYINGCYFRKERRHNRQRKRRYRYWTLCIDAPKLQYFMRQLQEKRRLAEMLYDFLDGYLSNPTGRNLNWLVVIEQPKAKPKATKVDDDDEW